MSQYLSHSRLAMDVSEALNNSEINTSALPRWQRKALAASALNTSTASSAKGDRSFHDSPSCDRFIANRSAMNLDASHYALADDNGNSNVSHASSLNDSTDDGAHFRRNLSVNLMPGGSAENSASVCDVSHASSCADGSDAPHRVLAFKQKAPAPPDGHANSLRVLYTQNKGAAPRVKSTRHIPSAPERILDAPDMVDDYYLNLMDWSVNNLLAVALGPRVYLWNAATGAAEQLCELVAPDDFVTSVSWIKEGGGYLALGTNSADVQLWDAAAAKQVRSMKGHAARVGSLDWNAHLLSSGSRDATIFNHDVRVKHHHVSTLAGHSQEVCGLRWSHDGSTLASGSNDNTLCLWDAAAASSRPTAAAAAPSGTPSANLVSPKFTLTAHQAAVKALAWCPWQRGLLASGGGTADRCIKTWNASTGALLASVDTGSQVSALLWNPHDRELLSSHGFSNNQLTLWKYPSMVRIKELTGHTSRILHMVASPDGSMVASGSADESVRFWRVFGEAPQATAAGAKGGSAAAAAGSSATEAAAVGGGSLLKGLALR